MGFHPAGQAGLELLTSGDPTASGSQSAGITGVNCHAGPFVVFIGFTYVVFGEMSIQVLCRFFFF